MFARLVCIAALEWKVTNNIPDLTVAAPLFGAAMVSFEEALLLFKKWECENTPLLFCEQSSLNTLAMLGMIESAEGEVVKFRIQGFGYIDFHLSREVTFQYFDPAPHASMPSDVVEADNLPESTATGAGIVGVTPTGEMFMALEILVA
jgi:hypothetical protein